MLISVSEILAETHRAFLRPELVLLAVTLIDSGGCSSNTIDVSRRTSLSAAPGGTPVNKPLKSFPTSETPYNIDLHGDTLYVFQSNESGDDASVQIYEKGQTQPTRGLTDGAISSPISLAVDGSGNVFVAYFGPTFSSGVGEFVGGKMPMVPLPLAGGFSPTP